MFCIQMSPEFDISLSDKKLPVRFGNFYKTDKDLFAMGKKSAPPNGSSFKHGGESAFETLEIFF